MRWLVTVVGVVEAAVTVLVAAAVEGEGEVVGLLTVDRMQHR